MIRLVDLAAHHKKHAHSELTALKTAAAEGRYILGPDVSEFEKAFARYCGTRYCIGVGSGTEALTIALKAFGIGKGDEVIVPALTFISTAYAVLAAGAAPVFADVDAASITLDPSALAGAVTARTKAVIPVHLYGVPADMDAIMQFARRHRLTVIEDAAQAHGSTWRGKRAGSLGHAACFSFYPSKNLGCMGDGGALTTSDTKAMTRMRILGNIGQKEKYVHAVVGINSRLDSIQAAVLSARLAHLEIDNGKRQTIAARYRTFLSGLPLTLPDTPKGRETNYHLFVIRTAVRDGLKRYLLAHGIETGIHYPLPLHLEPTLAFLGYKKGAFPVSERVSREVLSLPMYPELTRKDQMYIIQKIRAYFSGATE